VDVVLKTNPNESRATSIRAQALLSLEEPRLAIRPNVTSDPARLVNLQAEFLSDNFADLPKLAAALEQVPAEFADPIGFWTGSTETPAGLRPKSA
jgi:hypothetical protein